MSEAARYLREQLVRADTWMAIVQSSARDLMTLRSETLASAVGRHVRLVEGAPPETPHVARVRDAMPREVSELLEEISAATPREAPYNPTTEERRRLGRWLREEVGAPARASSLPASAVVLHLKTQRGQPYGSVRRCCERCGVMVGVDTGAWTFDPDVWRAPPLGYVACDVPPATHDSSPRGA